MAALLRLAVPPIRWLDRSLRVHYGIFEFTRDPRCVLRLSLTPSPAAVRLGDGTAIGRGETVGELHFWNERTMAMFDGGATIRNGTEFRRRLQFSLRAVARYVENDSRFDKVSAFLARTSFSDRLPRERLAAMTRRWGFEVDPAPRTLSGRLGDFFDNLHASLMSIAFAGEGRGWRRPQRLERVRLWMPRAALLAFARPDGRGLADES